MSTQDRAHHRGRVAKSAFADEATTASGNERLEGHGAKDKTENVVHKPARRFTMRLRNKEIVNDEVVATRPSTGALPPAHPVDGALILGVGTRSEILTLIRNFARSVECAPTSTQSASSFRADLDGENAKTRATRGLSSDRWHTDETRHGLTSYVGFDASWADGPVEPRSTVRYREDGEGR